MYNCVGRELQAILEQRRVLFLRCLLLLHAISPTVSVPDASQDLHHLLDRRPQIPLQLQALEGHLGDAIDCPLRFGVGVVAELWINQLNNFMVLNPVESHVRQVDLTVAPAHVHSRFR